MRLFLIRHGQTAANRDDVFAGQVEVELTDKGREQAESIRPILEGLSFDRVYSSDLGRAVETQKLAMPGAEAIRTPLLREVRGGSLELKPFMDLPPEVREYIRRSPDYKRYGGESPEEVYERIGTFFRELETSGCESVAAFAHAGLIRFVLRYVLKTDFENTRLVIGNCSIHVFEYKDKMWRLLAWNYGAKL